MRVCSSRHAMSFRVSSACNLGIFILLNIYIVTACPRSPVHFDIRTRTGENYLDIQHCLHPLIFYRNCLKLILRKMMGFKDQKKSSNTGFFRYCDTKNYFDTTTTTTTIFSTKKTVSRVDGQHRMKSHDILIYCKVQ